MPDVVELTKALIAAESITPARGAVFDVLEAELLPLGFRVERFIEGEAPEGPVENLLALRGDGGTHFAFAGHLDVVPPGAGWASGAFVPEIRGGLLYGRGAVDMKGSIAAFVAAVASAPAEGTISLLITGDEEGPSVNGTVKVLEWMAANGQIPDACLVGEPTSKATLGDTLKIGRRGSMNAYVTVHGTQGHSAYPQKADNPVHRLVAALAELTTTPLDTGSEWFEATTLQVTGLQVDNTATNVIPAEARCFLNIRFNERHDSAKLTAYLREVLTRHAPRHDLRVVVSGESFLTQPGPFVEALARAATRATNATPKLDTGGGTSDARFITRYCPVAELGLVGSTMHQVDERVPVAELQALSRLYAAVIQEFFA